MAKKCIDIVQRQPTNYNLDSIDVYLHEKKNSNYIGFSDMPSVITYGKTPIFISVLDNDGDSLKSESTLLFEFKDTNGTLLFSDIANIEDVSGAAIIYVDIQDEIVSNRRKNKYFNIEDGIGTLTIVGELNDVPSEWKGNYNYKFTTNIEIRKSSINKSPIVLENHPKLYMTSSVLDDSSIATNRGATFNSVIRTYSGLEIDDLNTVGGRVGFIEISYKSDAFTTEQYDVLDTMPLQPVELLTPTTDNKIEDTTWIGDMFNAFTNMGGSGNAFGAKYWSAGNGAFPLYTPQSDAPNPLTGSGHITGEATGNESSYIYKIIRKTTSQERFNINYNPSGSISFYILASSNSESLNKTGNIPYDDAGVTQVYYKKYDNFSPFNYNYAIVDGEIITSQSFDVTTNTGSTIIQDNFTVPEDNYFAVYIKNENQGANDNSSFSNISIRHKSVPGINPNYFHKDIEIFGAARQLENLDFKVRFLNPNMEPARDFRTTDEYHTISASLVYKPEGIWVERGLGQGIQAQGNTDHNINLGARYTTVDSSSFSDAKDTITIGLASEASHLDEWGILKSVYPGSSSMNITIDGDSHSDADYNVDPNRQEGVSNVIGGWFNASRRTLTHPIAPGDNRYIHNRVVGISAQAWDSGSYPYSNDSGTSSADVWAARFEHGDVFMNNRLGIGIPKEQTRPNATLQVIGDVLIDGDITANQYVVSSSILHITSSFSSGSTAFGDSSDDTHTFTGQIYNNGALINSESYWLKEQITGVKHRITSSNPVFVDGQISSSGTFIGTNLSVTEKIETSNVMTSSFGSITAHGNITASGHISSSNYISGSSINTDGTGSIEHLIVKNDTMVANGSFIGSQSTPNAIQIGYLNLDATLINSALVIFPATTTMQFLGDTIKVAQDIVHDNDTNTRLRFEDDKLTLTAGNVDLITMTQNDAADDTIDINGNLIVTAVTASGDISSSNDFHGDKFYSGNHSHFSDSILYLKGTGDTVSLKPGTTGVDDAQPYIISLGGFSVLLDSDSNQTDTFFNIKRNSGAPNLATEVFRVNEDGGVVATSHITSSGHISSSNTVYAKNLILSGGTGAFTSASLAAGGSGGSTTNAAGSDTQVQFNDGGTNFGGDAGFTYNSTTDSVTVVGSGSFGYASISGDIHVGGDITASNLISNTTISSSGNIFGDTIVVNASTGSQAQLTVGGEISASKTIYADDFTGGLITDSNSGQFKGWKYRGFYNAGGYIHFGNGFWNLYRSTTKQITGHSTGVTINDTNDDVDFQIDGDTNDHVFFVDAVLEQIGIGLKHPTHELSVSGDISGSGWISGDYISGSSIVVNASTGSQAQLTVGGAISSSGVVNASGFQKNGSATFVDISDNTNLVGGTGITLTGDTLSTTDSEIAHDSLSGFVANEHIDHSTVSIASGTGLSGGGTIASTRTLSVDAVQTQITDVGALDEGSITSGFGTINNGASAITTTGTGSFGYVSVGSDIDVAGNITASNLTANTTISSSGDIFGKTMVVNASTGSSAQLTVGGSVSASGDLFVDDITADQITGTLTGTSTGLAGTPDIDVDDITAKGMELEGATTATKLTINNTGIASIDTIISLEKSSATNWTLGADGGDNHFKINAGSILSTTPDFKLDSSGNASFSGNVSASGQIAGTNYLSNGMKLFERNATTGIISAGNGGDASVNMNNITASGNISSSGTIISNIISGSAISGSWAGVPITHDYIGLDAIDGTNIADNAINSEHYTNASIDNEHLADNAVDTDEIADNAVSLAKMAGLARGKIIVGDASGDPSALGAGANGKILVADANGDPSWTSLSGDATLSAGALTIAANAVEGSMLNTNVAGTGLTVAGNNIDVDAAQTQITSVGTLTGLFVDSHITSSGNISASGDYFGATAVINASTGSSAQLTVGGSISASGDLFVDDITADQIAGTITTATQGTINHDSLAGFVANEHIDHTGVTLTAGDGMTGGGDISSNREFTVVGGTGITANADDIATNDSEIVHDNLSGFVANEHIDHSGVTLTAGAGLNGGGDITANRIFSVDSASMGSFYSASMDSFTTTGTGSFGYVSVSSDIDVAGNITASNLTANTTISSSGDIFGKTMVINASTGSSAQLTVAGAISASGDISGSKLHLAKTGAATGEKLLNVTEDGVERFHINHQGDIHGRTLDLDFGTIGLDGTTKITLDTGHIQFTNTDGKIVIYNPDTSIVNDQAIAQIQVNNPDVLGNTAAIIFRATQDHDEETAGGTKIQFNAYNNTDDPTNDIDYINADGTSPSWNIVTIDPNGRDGHLHVRGNVSSSGYLDIGTVSASNSVIINASTGSSAQLTVGGSVSASGIFYGDGSGLSNVSATLDIDGLGALGGTGLHQTDDHFVFSDDGTEKKITFSNLEDAIFGNISGDATVAAGGALTIEGTSVENSMLVNDGITIAGADTSLGGSITADTIAGQISADTISGNQINGGTIGSVTISQLGGALDVNNENITNIDVDSGTIDGTVIGGASAAAGTFTSVSATSISGSSVLIEGHAVDIRTYAFSNSQPYQLDLTSGTGDDRVMSWMSSGQGGEVAISGSLQIGKNVGNNFTVPVTGLAVEGTVSASGDLFIGSATTGTGTYISASNGNIEMNGSDNALLQVDGNISASGKIDGKLKKITHHAFFGHASSKIAVPGPFSTNESTAPQGYSFMIAPYSGSLLKVIMYNQTTNPGATTVGFVTGSFNSVGNSDDELDFDNPKQEITQDMVDDTNTLFKFSGSSAHFKAGDRIGLTVDAASSNNNWWNLTAVWEYDTTEDEGDFG